MIGTQDVNELIGSTAVDQDGDKLGRIEQVYLDDQTNTPAWATLSTGLFGTKETFVPLDGAHRQDDKLAFPYTKAQVKDAPRIDSDGHLSPDEENELYRYYQVGGSQDLDVPDMGYSPEQSRDGADWDDTRVVGHDTSGPTTDEAMTRSEEQLSVGTRTEEVGRARLRKYIVTENVTQTVPVSREEVRIEREPITDANRGDALDGPDLSDEEHEVILHAEQPVVQKETVPVERVRLDTETVTDEAQVNESVRKEVIETDADPVTNTAGRI